MGTAKMGILAYETKTGTVYQHGGQSLARSDDTKWFLLGIGPFQSGTVKSEVQTGVGQSHGVSSINAQSAIGLRRRSSTSHIGPPQGLPPARRMGRPLIPRVSSRAYSDVYR